MLLSHAVRVSAVTLALATISGRPAAAQNMQITAAGITLGGHVSGPPVEPQGMAGRVIVLEFWGVNCPPCIASMPHLEEMHRQLGPAGLLVIGAHAQGGTADDVRKVVRELGVTFTIVENASVRDGMDFSGIPHCMVFDHTGKCVFRGSPGNAAEAIATAVKAAPAAILAGRTLVKLAPLSEMLRNEAMCGAALKKARSLLTSKDADTADEAKFVVERIEARGGELLGRARELAESDPVAAAAAAQRCVTDFRGTEVGTDAGKLLVEWKKDKAFQAALKAGAQLARLEGMRSALAGGAAVVPPDALAAVPPAVKRQMKDLVAGVQKGAPGSKMADRAAEIASEFGVADAAGR